MKTDETFDLDALQKLITDAGAAPVKGTHSTRHLLFRVRAMLRAKRHPQPKCDLAEEKCRAALVALEKHLPQVILLREQQELGASENFKELASTEFYRRITTGRSAILKNLAAAVEGARAEIPFNRREPGEHDAPENDGHAWDFRLLLEQAWREADTPLPTDAARDAIIAKLLLLAGFPIEASSLAKKWPTQRGRGRPKKNPTQIG